MKNINNPARSDWPELCKRPSLELEFLEGYVRNIINRVKIAGDNALKDLSLQYDKVKLDSIVVTPTEITKSREKIPEELKNAIRIAKDNITKFHIAQQREILQVETMPGVKCWRKAVAIEKVGIYVPGGTAPLFSTLLMLGVPASLAGCKEIILCSPARPDGSIDPAILYTADEIGISKVYKVGGAQAIAAMAFGTTSIPEVYKIFGPGNQYVTKAKQVVSLEGIAIDMPAGPSEVLIVADETAHPGFVAADLISQAEHGSDSQVVLLSTSQDVLSKVQCEVEVQIEALPRKEIAIKALNGSLSILLNTRKDIVDFVNTYAPEHLILNISDCEAMAEEIINAGSVFLGGNTPESVGDYASGTNHTLPTNGFAKAYSGVSLESFQKFITFQQLTKGGLKTLGPVVEIMAAAEQLQAHKNAVSIRLKSYEL